MPRAKTQLKRKKSSPKTGISGNKRRKTVKKDEFTMPKWQDCTWKRIPCGEDSCSICGRIKQNRMRHIAKGENPDSMEAAIEDVSRDFSEIFSMLQKDTERTGTDINDIKDDDHERHPKAHEFPLYNKVVVWRDNVYKIVGSSDDTSSAWLFTEAGEDLLWYSNTLIVKTYKQLSARWEIAQGKEDVVFEYKYTAGVLAKCLDILKSALTELTGMDIAQSKQFNIALLCLSGIEGEILEIVK